ncbi:MAG: tetratricopeptide repeat protein [Sandaracinus sp.]
MSTSLRTLACVVILLAATSARAQEGSSSPGAQITDLDERARVHFQAGTDYFERGDYEAALRELELAHQMSPRPALLYNLGSCLERMGRLDDAADRLEQYVAEAHPADGAAISERAQRLRARARAVAGGSSESRPDTGSDSRSDTGSDSRSDTGSDSRSDTGSDGRSDTGSDSPSDSPSGDPSDAGSGAGSGRTPHVASWITLGVGAAALAGFAVLGGLALAEDGALETRCGTSCTRDDVGTLEGLAIGADVSLAVGLVLAATGVVLALSTDEGSPETPRVELGPGALRVRF